VTGVRVAAELADTSGGQHLASEVALNHAACLIIVQRIFPTMKKIGSSKPPLFHMYGALLYIVNSCLRRDVPKFQVKMTDSNYSGGRKTL
jgi:hypothetical protein